jgi:GNAT superfamily N-acetyltransferase
MHFRLAIIADAPVLSQMNERLIRDERHRNPMSLAELESRMKCWLAGEYRAALFEDDAGPAGYALFRFDPDYVYLRQFFIVPDRRRQGRGREAMAWLSQNVFPPDVRVRIDVLVSNLGVIDFWHAIGFTDYAITMEKPDWRSRSS